MRRSSPIASPGDAVKRAEALEWLAGRVRWEGLLADLRDTTDTTYTADVEIDEAA